MVVRLNEGATLNFKLQASSWNRVLIGTATWPKCDRERTRAWELLPHIAPPRSWQGNGSSFVSYHVHPIQHTPTRCTHSCWTCRRSLHRSSRRLQHTHWPSSLSLRWSRGCLQVLCCPRTQSGRTGSHGSGWCELPFSTAVCWLTCWTQAFDGMIHFTFEGSFLYLSTFGRSVVTSEGPFAELCAYSVRLRSA